MAHDASARDERFRRLYADHFAAVLGYALRRAAADDAADVTADTFLVAWRRLDDVPAPPATRLWLYGVARRTLANQRRGTRRRQDLSAELRVGLAAAIPDHAPTTDARVDATTGIEGLPEAEREVMRLAAWEGLAPREIAEVLGISPTAARKRLSRARSRLRSSDAPERGHDPRAPGHVSSVHTHRTPEEGHR